MTALELLLPHRPPMLLLTALNSSSADCVRAYARVTEAMPFLRSDGALERCAHVELMAQCFAAGAGERKRARNLEAPAVGYLASVRDCTVFFDAYLGDDLTIEVVVCATIGAITCFRGQILRGDTRLSAGEGKIYVPEAGGHLRSPATP